MTTCKARPIDNFVDFAGSQAEAARLLQISESHMSLIANGKRNVTPALALRIERLSGGRFAKEAFVWPDAETVCASRNKGDAIAPRHGSAR